MIEDYNADRHFEMIHEWSLGYGWDLVSSDWLPKYGAVIPGVAACFLYRTDSSVAHVDCLIANPKASPESKQEGLNMVIEAVIERARKDGFSNLIGHSFIPGVAKRCELLGFEKMSNRDFKLIKRL